MSLPSLRLQHITFIRSLYDEGTVNDQFLRLQANMERNDAVIRAITSYYLDSKQLFISLSILIEQPTVDFEKVHDFARDFYDKSCAIGAETVRCTCAELIRASQNKDKDSCSIALYWTKNRFSYLRGKFETLVQILMYLKPTLKYTLGEEGGKRIGGEKYYQHGR